MTDGGIVAEARPGWWAVALTAGPYQDSPALVVHREDDAGEQRRLVSVDLTAPAGTDDADLVLARQGWRRLEDWAPIGEDGSTAQIARTHGRPPDGMRVETKLWLDDLGPVDALIGVRGRNRSQVLAHLIRLGLRAEAKDA